MLAIAKQVCNRVDWQRPELADTKFSYAYKNGDFLGAARGLVQYLRERNFPVIGVSADYLKEFRSAATPEMLKHAREQMDQDLTKEHSATGGFGGRGSVITSFPAEALQLAATEEDLHRIGEILATEKEEWGKWARWGTTFYICKAIGRLWPLKNCPDDTFIPFLALLLARLDTEWTWAKTWDEAILGSSGHNWWITTFSGFWMAGLMFPEFKGLEQFRAFAPEWLERETRLLFESDGFTKERSGYHWGTVEEIYLATVFAQKNGLQFSPSHHERLRTMAAANWKLITPDGDLPYVGDTGAGRSPGWLLGKLRIDVARYGLAESKWVAESLMGPWQPPSTWNGAYAGAASLDVAGELLRERYLKVVPCPPPTLDTVLPQSGYYCVRSDWTKTADYICIDAGARGNIVSSHDHTAVFHILLHSHGRPILVDNYSGHYGDNPARLYRIGSSAHNVATVDDHDQIPMKGEYRWHMPVLPQINEWISDKNFAYFNGTHEGYARLTNAVPSSRRKLFYLRGKYWILIDRFTACSEGKDKEHTYRQYFHTVAPARLDDDGRLITSGKGGNLMILPVAGARGEAKFGPNPFPLEGYENPSELCYTQEFQGHGLFVTVLVPFEDERLPDVSAELLPVRADNRAVSPWEITALAITLDGEKHLYVDQHMEWNLPWKVGGKSGQGRLFHSEAME